MNSPTLVTARSWVDLSDMMLALESLGEPVDGLLSGAAGGQHHGNQADQNRQPDFHGCIPPIRNIYTSTIVIYGKTFVH